MSRYAEGLARPILVTGDWLLPDGPDSPRPYRRAYEAVDLDRPWNGFASPVFTRDVLEKVIADQALLEEQGIHEYEVFTIEADGRLRINYERVAPEQADSLVDPDERGWYHFAFGWTWCHLEDPDEAEEKVLIDWGRV